MSEQENDGNATAVLDRPDMDEPRGRIATESDDNKGKKKRKDEDDLEYEVEFATPFGKLEFEFEPLSKKEKKDRERKAKAEREAAKKVAERAKQAQMRSASGGGGLLGKLVIVLVVVAVIGALVALAYWLFARPEEDLDAIPADFANAPPEPVPGFAAKMRRRVRAAVRSGRRASFDAQREQREKFERMAKGAGTAENA